MIVELPWPTSKLSGHATGGHWSGKSKTVKNHRNWAMTAANAQYCKNMRTPIPSHGDINTIVTFYPPDNRSDRLNYPNRMKPYFDGIADGLGVNDKRFSIPQYVVAPVDKKNARVTVEFV